MRFLFVVMLFACCSAGPLESPDFQLSNLTLQSSDRLLDWVESEAWEGGVVPTQSSSVLLWCAQGPSQLSLSVPQTSSYTSLELQGNRLLVMRKTKLNLQYFAMDGNSSLLPQTTTEHVTVKSASCNLTAGSTLRGDGGAASLDCDQLNVLSSEQTAEWTVWKVNISSSGTVILGENTRIVLGHTIVNAKGFVCAFDSCSVLLSGDVTLAIRSMIGGSFASDLSDIGVLLLPEHTSLSLLNISGSGDMFIVYITNSLQIIDAVTFEYLDIHANESRTTTNLPLISVKGNLSFHHQVMITLFLFVKFIFFLFFLFVEFH
jgi:hypothetical protein